MEANHINLQVSWLENVNFYVKFCTSKPTSIEWARCCVCKASLKSEGWRWARRNSPSMTSSWVGTQRFCWCATKKRRFFLSNNVPFLCEKTSCNCFPRLPPSQDRKILVFSPEAHKTIRPKRNALSVESRTSPMPQVTTSTATFEKSTAFQMWRSQLNL